MKRCALLLAFFVSIGLQALLAQNLQISGKVTSSEDGSPIPGVSVVVKGTTVGTVTDANGEYRLSVPQNATALMFSFIGMKTVEQPLTGQTTINVVLTPETMGLNEVVVTALGLKKQEKSLGYAATTVNAESFERSSQINAMNALQGKVAGVEISSAGGSPSASTKVIIRGYSSLASNNPLYVVDGVPIDNSSRITSARAGLDYGNRANDINPNDIESMTILKGAAATALYGSRAANGAVIIQTKTGRSTVGGKAVRIEVNSSVSSSDVLRIPAMQNTFGQGWSGHWTDDENGSWGPEMDGKVRAWGMVKDGAQKIKPFSPVKDNVYEFYDYGMQYNNSVSIYGGSENSSYRLSYNNINADGVIPTNVDSYKKNILSLTGKTGGNKFSASTSIFYVNTRGGLTPDGYGGSNSAANLYSELLQIPRDFSIVDLKDYKNDPFNTLDYYFTPYAFNPYFALNENQSKFFENRVYGNVQLDYKITDWLSATGRVGGDVSSFNRKDWEAVMQFTPGTPQFIKAVTPNAGNVLEENLTTQELNSYVYLSYNKSFLSDELTLDGVLGYNTYQRSYKGQDANITTLVIPGFYNLSNTDAEKNASTALSQKRQYAYYGTANLGFRGFAYLNLSARQEYSSTLPKNANSYFYPAVSVALLANELFPALKDYAQLVKIRASYGLAGNDAPPYDIDPYFATSVVAIPFSSLNFPLPGTGPYSGQQVGAFEKGNQLGNPNLKPEITTEKEIGADIRLLNSRLLLDLALYNRVSDGQILSVNIPPSSGFITQVVNFGKMENKGVELAATVVPVRTPNFEWNLSTTYTKNHNKVLALPGESGELVLQTVYQVQMVAIEGKPVGIFRAPEYLKDDQGHVIVNSSTGLPKATTEYTEIGGILPKFTLGLTNGFRYKNVDLSFAIDWRKGGYMYSGTADLNYFVGNATQTLYNNRQPWLVENSVKDNPEYNETTNPGVPKYVENDVPITMANVNAYYYHTNNPAANRDRVIPRDYLKLRDLSLAYTIPTRYISKLPVDRVSLVLSGRNLLLFTPKGNNFIDPESTSFGNDLLSEFGEFRTGPTVRSFTASLRVNF